jgi:MOSC domain-containing protein YiiM
MMKILQICVGTPQDVEFGGKRMRTSIFKSPVEGRVAVRQLNIDGDEQSDLTVHGGRNKAIYVYSHDYYSDWIRVLDVQALQDAQFGENLTITGGTDEQVLIGSRYRIGDTEVTVSQPRLPCFKLGIRLNDKTFPQKFWLAGRLGFYLRVEAEGSIECGQAMDLIDEPGHGITIRRLYEIMTGGEADEATHALENLAHLDTGLIRRLRRIAKNSS